MTTQRHQQSAHPPLRQAMKLADEVQPSYDSTAMNGSSCTACPSMTPRETRSEAPLTAQTQRSFQAEHIKPKNRNRAIWKSTSCHLLSLLHSSQCYKPHLKTYLQQTLHQQFFSQQNFYSSRCSVQSRGFFLSAKTKVFFEYITFGKTLSILHVLTRTQHIDNTLQHIATRTVNKTSGTKSINDKQILAKVVDFFLGGMPGKI